MRESLPARAGVSGSLLEQVVGSQKVNFQCWLCLGFRMGTGKPVGFPKRVTRVWVRCWVLVHRDTPRTRTAVSRVSTGKLQCGECNFFCFKTCFF